MMTVTYGAVVTPHPPTHATVLLTKQLCMGWQDKTHDSSDNHNSISFALPSWQTAIVVHASFDLFGCGPFHQQNTCMIFCNRRAGQGTD